MWQTVQAPPNAWDHAVAQPDRATGMDGKQMTGVVTRRPEPVDHCKHELIGGLADDVARRPKHSTTEASFIEGVEDLEVMS